MRKPLKHKPEKPRKSAVLRSEIALNRGDHEGPAELDQSGDSLDDK
jgi:hypothetical protein